MPGNFGNLVSDDDGLRLRVVRVRQSWPAFCTRRAHQRHAPCRGSWSPGRPPGRTTRTGCGRPGGLRRWRAARVEFPQCPRTAPRTPPRPTRCPGTASSRSTAAGRTCSPRSAAGASASHSLRCRSGWGPGPAAPRRRCLPARWMQYSPCRGRVAVSPCASPALHDRVMIACGWKQAIIVAGGHSPVVSGRPVTVPNVSSQSRRVELSTPGRDAARSTWTGTIASPLGHAPAAASCPNAAPAAARPHHPAATKAPGARPRARPPGMPPVRRRPSAPVVDAGEGKELPGVLVVLDGLQPLRGPQPPPEVLPGPRAPEPLLDLLSRGLDKTETGSVAHAQRSPSLSWGAGRGGR